MSAVGGCLQSSRGNGETQQPLTLTSFQQQQQPQLRPPRALYVWERQRNQTFLRCTSAFIPQSCLRQLRCTSALYRTEQKSPLAERTKLDANRGKFIGITTGSINLPEQFKMCVKKTVHRDTPCDGLMIMTVSFTRKCNMQFAASQFPHRDK